MKIAKAIKFCQEYTKLKNDFFLTVRWTDTEYNMGDTLPIWLKGKPTGEKGRILFTTKVKLDDLGTWGFTNYDANCLPFKYFQMMEKWYQRKKDWNGLDSIVQIVGVQKVK